MVISIRQGTADDGGFIINNNIHVTRRELETLSLIGTGLDNNEVAKKIGCKCQYCEKPYMESNAKT